MRRLFLPALFAVLAACTRAATPGDPVDDNAAKDGKQVLTSQEAEWKAIEQLEAQAKSIARIEGCASSADCRAAAIGSRACGGPRYYIPYCSKTTDSAALFTKASEIAKAEQAYNIRYQLASTCEFRMPPAVESSGGSCVAK